MIVYLVAAIADFMLAGIVLAHDRSRTAVSFAFLCCCLAIWSTELFFLASVHDVASLAPLFQITRMGMFFIGPATFLFATLITRTRVNWVLGTGLALSFANAAVTSLVNWIAPTKLLVVPGGHSPELDGITVAFYANLAMASLASVYICAVAYKGAIFRERLRIKWIMYGVTIGVICGWLHALWPKLYIGIVGSILCLYFISYAVIRYRLIGVKVAVSDGIVRALAAIPLIFVFVAFDQICDSMELKTDGYLVAQILMFLALLQMYPWLVEYLSEKRSKIFPPASKGYSFTIGQVQNAFKSTLTPQTFSRVCEELLRYVIRVDGYSFHLVPRLMGETGEGLRLFDPGSKPLPEPAPMSPIEKGTFLEMLFAQEETLFYDEAAPAFKGNFARLGASALVPVRIADETVGFLLLGAPKKEEQFSYDDIRLLNWFGEEVGPVLENLLAMMRLESSLDEAEKTLSVVSRLNEYNHDIKTPFSNIEALLLAGDAFSNEERQAKILDQVRKGHALVSTMTGLLKGQHTHQADAYDLNAVIRRVVASFPTKASLVRTELGPLPLLEGYEDEMELLFSNLLSNAFAAQDKPEHQVRV
ncbi:histidine kinase N-terminal 7TM domain-containing protein, partial [Kordiimonas marina]|uniref:histidine kinase N-terminal 7TM domain-containing protein n=1 Tax=Kordiimonas marina TaxID=2872312 RepID=UPI001FF0EEF1